MARAIASLQSASRRRTALSAVSSSGWRTLVLANLLVKHFSKLFLRSAFSRFFTAGKSNASRRTGTSYCVTSGAWSARLNSRKGSPAFARCEPVKKNPGGDLLSHQVTLAVPSALKSLTSEFGMGSGGTSSLSPPEIVRPSWRECARHPVPEYGLNPRLQFVRSVLWTHGGLCWAARCCCSELRA